MFYRAGISIALFVVALLLNKEGKSRSDMLLILWMLMSSMHIALQYSFVQGSMLDYPFLFGIAIPLPLLHGVFLYFYVSSVTDQFPETKLKTYIHFVPFALAILYLAIFFFPLPTETKRAVIESEGEGHELFTILLMGSIMLSGVVYVIWSMILLRRHEKNILNQFSRVENINLRWLQFLIIGLGLIWLVVIFSQKDEYIFTGVVIFIILMGYFGLQQIDIYSRRRKIEVPVEKVESKEPKAEKYSSSGLSNSAADELYQTLLDQMESGSIYKQQELSISDLAELLGTHPNYLSQVINEKGGMKFFDFVNNYRIDEFKRLVADPKNKKFTMLSLAYDCGFNSKSSFNRYFKKVTGQTPSQYVNSSISS